MADGSLKINVLPAKERCTRRRGVGSLNLNLLAFENGALITGTATTVNIPRRVDQAQVVLVK
jgi:hypothetical protein